MSNHREMVYEDVPSIRRRNGDNIIAGANNACIILGRDRPSAVESGFGSFSSPSAGKAAGSIHLVVGRATEDLSLADDRATVYISSRTDVDKNAKSDAVDPKVADASGVIIRADCIRISPRNDFKIFLNEKTFITISDGKIVLDGEIELGKGAVERILKGESFVSVFEQHKHTTPSGVSGPPVVPVPDSVYSARTVRVY